MLTADRLVDRILREDSRQTSVALCDADVCLTYAELVSRVERRSAELDLDERSVVVLTGDRSIEFVTTYLALLDGGHVPLLAGARAEPLAATWDAAALVDVTGDTIDIAHRRHGIADLHPDLALLLSTSGSTGSPKLVRLSHRNLSSNAHAIAEYLDLSPADRGISSLPLHYCYGLSVLHSHLAVGASVAMIEASVVDPCFRAALDAHGITNLAGVPHTFELLDRAGPEDVFVPSMRFLTQAGGRLSPESVRRWISMAETRGVDFYVMYGQTEATARMAYLRPEDGARSPGSIGRPIPGGSFELIPVEGRHDDAGELVYRGPNVMLGYAERTTDLALGDSVEALATGDLARRDPDTGLYEIVGRTSRFVKPFGLRIDLDEVEARLRERIAGEVAVGGTDECVVVVAPGADHTHVAALAAAITSLPRNALDVDVERPLPRTSSSKIDYASIATRPAGAGRQRHDEARRPSAIFADVLGRRSIPPDATFVSLGGDSLSYVECSIRLEQTLGRLPGEWHLRPVGELDDLTEQPPRRLARVDTTVVLRALAICAVVSTHMRLRFVPGGAHILLAVVGFNLARFMIPIESTRERVMAGLRTAGRVAVPTVVWAWIAWGFGATYGLGTVLLINNYVGPPGHRGDHWHFWFIEVFVQLILIVTALLAIPAVRRFERRFPYLFPLLLFAATTVLRMEWAWIGDWYNIRFRTHNIAWFLVLGWLIARSDSVRTRAFTSLIVVVSLIGFFDYLPREVFIATSLVVLVWIREMPVPRPAVRPIATLASASLWILISHFTIWPLFIDVMPLSAAYVATLVSGILVWLAAERVIDTTTQLVRAAHRTAFTPRRQRALT